MAADFTMGIWVDAVEVATVKGRDWINGHSWSWGGRQGLGNYPHFVSSFYRCSGSPLHFSAILGSGIFLVKELLFWENGLVCGCDWVWAMAWVLGQVCPPTLGMSSFS